MNKTTIIAVSIIGAVAIAGASFAGGFVIGRVTNRGPMALAQASRPFAGRGGFATGGGAPIFGSGAQATEVRQIITLLRTASTDEIQKVLTELQNSTGTSSGSSTVQ